MDDIEWRRLARERSRARKNGTPNPSCSVCGEHHWAVRFDLHHFAERKYDDRVIRLCHSCHDKVTDMLKDFPPIPPGTESRLAKIIMILRGRMTMNRLMLETDQELHDWLIGAPVLPPPLQAEGCTDGA